MEKEQKDESKIEQKEECMQCEAPSTPGIHTCKKGMEESKPRVFVSLAIDKNGNTGVIKDSSVDWHFVVHLIADSMKIAVDQIPSKPKLTPGGLKNWFNRNKNNQGGAFGGKKK